MVVIQPGSIVQVLCFTKDSIYSGTAFRVGPDGLGLSVNHVTSVGGSCWVAGKPLNLAYKSPKLDFSEIEMDDGPYLQIDCGGFVKGRNYLAIGFARGVSPATTVELTGTGATDPSNGQSILTGMVPVIPGQSGGPVIDEETGRVVGTVNAENFEEGLSWSVPLSSTPVCGKNA
jgi:hypothetical protein